MEPFTKPSFVNFLLADNEVGIDRLVSSSNVYDIEVAVDDPIVTLDNLYPSAALIVIVPP